MDDHQQLVSGEDIGQVLTGAVAFDDLVHGVDDGLETCEALDARDDRGLRDVDGIVAAEEGHADAVAHGRADVTHDGGHGEQRDEQADDDAEDERGQCRGRLLGKGGGIAGSLQCVTRAEAGGLVGVCRNLLFIQMTGGEGVIGVRRQVGAIGMLMGEVKRIGAPVCGPDEEGLALVLLPAKDLRLPRGIVVEVGPHAEVVEDAGTEDPRKENGGGTGELSRSGARGGEQQCEREHGIGSEEVAAFSAAREGKPAEGAGEAAVPVEDAGEERAKVQEERGGRAPAEEKEAEHKQRGRGEIECEIQPSPE